MAKPRAFKPFGIKNALGELPPREEHQRIDPAQDREADRRPGIMPASAWGGLGLSRW